MKFDETGAVMELASRLYNAPLAIHPDVLHFLSWCKLDMQDMASWAEHHEASLEAKAQPFTSTPVEGQSAGSVAVIPIRGSLMRSTFFSDYDAIASDFQAAVQDSSVSAIVLDVDSPGGEVRGMFDLADQIFEARGIKPIIAHANDQMTSAAYALASSADQIVASPTASIGSIGVVAMHVDQSVAAENAGLKMTEVASGEAKTALSPNRPLSDLGKAVLEKAVNSAADQFFGLVSRNRDLEVDAIRSHEAGVFTASEAVENGLADRVASRSTVLRELTNPSASGVSDSSVSLTAEEPVSITSSRSEGSRKMAEDASETTLVDGEAPIVETPLAEVEEIETEESNGDSTVNALEAAHAEGRAVAAQEAQEIIELCTLAGTPAAAAAFIAAGESVNIVRARLLEAKVIQGESTDINNQVDALTSASEPQVELDPAAIYHARRAGRKD